MKKDDRKICGTCKWKRQELPFSDYYCSNEESDCYTLECEYTDSCCDWEEKERTS